MIIFLKKMEPVFIYYSNLNFDQDKSLYKELAGDRMKFERTNDSSPFTSYTIKLVDN